MYEKYIKRLLDFIISGMGIIILLPVFIVIYILVKIKLGSPVIFKQERPGKDEKIFILYKFRSMSNSRDNKGNLLDEDKRLTRFGRKLRGTSLDELPQLFNILKGDMAIVGPRPLLVEYLPLYNKEQKKRHNVRPGLTGLAQVTEGDSSNWDEKLKLDTIYTKNITFRNDLNIIFKTVSKVFKKENRKIKREAKFTKFRGSV